MNKSNSFLLSLLILLAFSITSCRNQPQQNSRQTNNRQMPPNGQGRQRPTPAQMITQMDLDKDGRLSRNEVRGRMKNRFDVIDTNQDGFLTLQELRDAPRPQRNNGQRGNAPNQRR